MLQLFPNGLPDDLDALEKQREQIARKVFTGKLSLTEAARARKLIDERKAQLINQSRSPNESNLVSFEACEDFEFPATLQAFQEITFQLPQILYNSSEITMAMATDGGMNVVPVQRLSTHVIRISVPLHAEGQSETTAQFILMDANGWNETGVRCAPKTAQILPPEVETGAFQRALILTANSFFATQQFAQGLNIAAPFSSQTFETNISELETEIARYQALPLQQRWLLDALYSSTSPMGEALQKSAQSHSEIRSLLMTKPRRTANVQEQLLPQFADTKIIAATFDKNARFQVSQISPLDPALGDRIPFVDVCPANGAELDEMLEMAVRGRIRGDADVKVWFTASQISAGVSARLFVIGTTGNLKMAEAADRAVNVMGARFYLMQDYYAGMFPSKFVKLDAQLNHGEIFEDSGDPEVVVSDIILHTRSAGYDLAKAVVDTTLLVASATGTSVTKGGKLISKTTGKIQDTHLAMRKLFGSTWKIKNVNRTKSFVNAKIIFDIIGGSMVSAIEGDLTGRAADAAKGSSKTTELPPVECIVDINEQKYARINLVDRSTPDVMKITEFAHYQATNEGSVKFVIEPERGGGVFALAKGQPKKELTFSIPKITYTTHAPSSVASGASVTIETDIYSFGEVAQIDWNPTNGVAAFYSDDLGRYIDLTVVRNKGCTPIQVIISGQFSSPHWLLHSTTEREFFGISFAILPEKKPGECDEEEEDYPTCPQSDLDTRNDAYVKQYDPVLQGKWTLSWKGGVTITPLMAIQHENLANDMDVDISYNGRYFQMQAPGFKRIFAVEWDHETNVDLDLPTNKAATAGIPANGKSPIINNKNMSCVSFLYGHSVNSDTRAELTKGISTELYLWITSDQQAIGVSIATIGHKTGETTSRDTFHLTKK